MLGVDDLLAFQEAATRVYVDREVAGYAVALAGATRRPADATTVTTVTGDPNRQLVRALDLVVRRRVDGLLAGEHPSTTLGHGTDLARVRPYEPGDDVRFIDWSVTADTANLPRLATVRRSSDHSAANPRAVSKLMPAQSISRVHQ